MLEELEAPKEQSKSTHHPEVLQWLFGNFNHFSVPLFVYYTFGLTLHNDECLHYNYNYIPKKNKKRVLEKKKILKNFSYSHSHNYFRSFVNKSNNFAQFVALGLRRKLKLFPDREKQMYIKISRLEFHKFTRVLSQFVT